MTKKFLDRVYDSMTPEETLTLYEAWADSYDAETAENGYATPDRVAKALRAHLSDPNTPVLDFGCGTGLSGLALKGAGCAVIDGVDPSDKMLAGAREKGCYRRLAALDIHDPAPIPKGTYRAICAIGVIGTGAAPASTFDLLLKALPQSGLLAVSLNDHALRDPYYEGAMNAWLDCGAARLLFKEYGPHLPGRNLKSNVYIIEIA